MEAQIESGLWKFGNTSVVWEASLCSGGDWEAHWYVDFLRRRFPGKKFKKAYEWCCGPAFIGFALLEAGICDQLCVADVNERAIECVKRTLKENPKWADKVTYYVSDNLQSVPDGEKFDLVVGNPPYGYTMPGYTKPRYGRIPLLTCDPEFRIHRAFYRQIGKHLLPGAWLCISELCPFEQEPGAKELKDGPWDIRPRVPILDFIEMIDGAGFQLREVAKAGPAGPNIEIDRQIPLIKDPERPIEWGRRGDWFWILVVASNKSMAHV